MSGKVSNCSKRRVLESAEYIVQNNSTIREAAKHIGTSKSTIHRDLSLRLPYIDINLYRKVNIVLERNLSERHIRGGIATRKVYKNARRNQCKQ